MKWLKRVLIALVLLVVLAGVLAVYLIATFDPNAYKDRISAVVKEQTGRDLVIEGEIGLSLFPWLGLSLGETWLSNAEGFADEPFARIGEVELSVALMPLLRRELQVQRIRLVGLNLNLERDAQGRSNWDDLVAEAEADGREDRERHEGAGEGPGLKDLDIGGVEILDARVSWRDAQAGTALRVDPLNLELGRIRLGVETPLSLSLTLIQEDPALRASVDLNALVNVDLDAQRYALRRLVARLQAEGEALPRAMEVKLEADAAVNLAEDVASLERLTLESLGVQLVGLVRVNNLTGEKPVATGELRSNTFSVRELLTQLGEAAPETADPEVLKKVAVDLAFEANAEAASLSQLLIQLDDTRLRGSARVSNFERPAIRAELDVDRINLDRYLPPPAEEAAAPRPDAPAREGWPDDPIDLPVEMLRNLNLNAQLTIGEMIINRLNLARISLTLTARDGLVEVKPLTANLYNGSVEALMSLDVRGDTPRYSFEPRLQGVQIGPLLDDLTEGEGKLAGTTQLNARITTRGNSVKQMVSALNGDGRFEFANGAVKGINIAQIIRDAEARFRGRTVERSDEPNQTDFSELRGSFTIANGVVTNNDLAASSPLLRVRGQGTADLPREQLDYRVDTTLVATLEGQGGRSLDELRGVNLPIRIRGSFSDPSFSLDLRPILEGRVREEAERRIEEQVTPRIEERREDIEQQLRDRLPRLPGLR
ncbi:AsmA family protein [Thioalkalivibrio sulfidiphilus HL-EbGr7]|uniref:AsmA family protein n=1 Tax=Thioalkalivibrio sulfidiphilus (strain HL-EbGR7) TaxID=396588 RepID=B8GPA0_THISH|nr:AsmA family protein [Thioalkalivibrio sulfidiphilus]ACL74020.1 AsmA family protein [Thioalkalivibrio sulfidiphilus HL-EbGr7]